MDYRIKDSFDERFGDDLFEFIVSYLPIKYKLKYESVSKRFQRLAFNRQKTLILNRKPYESADGLPVNQFVTNLTFSSSKLKSLLKKFPFITRIEFRFKGLHNMSDILNTIANNCQHLNAIHFDFNDVTINILKKFCHKFGNQLKHISFDSIPFSSAEEEIKQLFKFSENLKSISNFESNLIDNTIVSKKFIRIEDMIVFSEDKNPFRLLSNNCLMNLKRLDIFVEIKSNPNLESIKELSELKQLKVLKIFTEIKEYGSDFWVKTFESMANNCLNLEYFSFCFSFNTISKTKSFDSKKCFESMAQFSNLKILCFVTQMSCPAKDIQNLNCLKNCKNLLSLNIQFNSINDQLFDGIDLIVPNLKQISFGSIQQSLISDKVLESIGCLNQLTHIEISGNTKVGITGQGVRQLINGCKRLKLFRTRINIRFRFFREVPQIKRLIEEYKKNIEIDLNYRNPY